MQINLKTFAVLVSGLFLAAATAGCSKKSNKSDNGPAAKPRPSARPRPSADARARPAPSHLTPCTDDGDCVITLYPGCCSCCKCAKRPYVITRKALKSRKAKCAGVKCDMNCPKGGCHKCPPPQRPDDPRGAVCVKGTCKPR